MLSYIINYKILIKCHTIYKRLYVRIPKGITGEEDEKVTWRQRVQKEIKRARTCWN